VTGYCAGTEGRWIRRFQLFRSFPWRNRNRGGRYFSEKGKEQWVHLFGWFFGEGVLRLFWGIVSIFVFWKFGRYYIDMSKTINALLFGNPQKIPEPVVYQDFTPQTLIDFISNLGITTIVYDPLKNKIFIPYPKASNNSNLLVELDEVEKELDSKKVVNELSNDIDENYDENKYNFNTDPGKTVIRDRIDFNNSFLDLYDFKDIYDEKINLWFFQFDYDKYYYKIRIIKENDKINFTVIKFWVVDFDNYNKPTNNNFYSRVLKTEQITDIIIIKNILNKIHESLRKKPTKVKVLSTGGNSYKKLSKKNKKKQKTKKRII